MTELQGWYVVAFAGLASLGTCFRAWVAWREHRASELVRRLEQTTVFQFRGNL